GNAHIRFLSPSRPRSRRASSSRRAASSSGMPSATAAWLSAGGGARTPRDRRAAPPSRHAPTQCYLRGSMEPRRSFAGYQRRWRRQHQRLAEFDDLRDAPIVDHLETHQFSNIEVGPYFARAVDQMVDAFEGNLEKIVFVIIGNT